MLTLDTAQESLFEYWVVLQRTASLALLHLDLSLLAEHITIFPRYNGWEDSVGFRFYLSKYSAHTISCL